jgi:hypothetical protein
MEWTSPFVQLRTESVAPATARVTRFAYLVLAGRHYADLKMLCESLDLPDDPRFSRLLNSKHIGSPNEWSWPYDALQRHAREYVRAYP